MRRLQSAVRVGFRIPLLLWSAAVLFPVLWMFLGAFKSNGEIFASPWSLPASFSFDNFAAAWTDFRIGSSFLNSILVTALGSVLCLLFAIPTAYAIERVPFRGSKVLYNVYLSVMMIPMVLGWIPLFFLLMKFDMLNNLWALALVYAVREVPFSIFVLTSFMGIVPKDLEHAAAIDGMSPYGVLFTIVTPLVKTGIVTVTIMNALHFWNEYFMAMIFLQSESKYTIGVAMDLMNKNAQFQNAWGALFAGMTIATVPVVIAYAAFQRHIVRGMVEGAMKG